MKVKEIEGMRIKPGETLVIVPRSMLSCEQLQRLQEDLKRNAIDRYVVFPPGTNLYVADGANS